MPKRYDIGYYEDQKLSNSELSEYLSLGAGILAKYNDLWHFRNPLDGQFGIWKRLKKQNVLTQKDGTWPKHCYIIGL